ncbi:RagB/SusD family nutrient uptake outer membrane protein [Pedobacter cryophilus]|uniref:RagB/SusD family nutrient uptake outer membrane protein n=1 Tax=Pedobacter cryophilus TaxID=2571271 RepID=A0A4V5NXC3_9SPHI|nr:RagB/SusD family nutrient uptake outer membrane protein [Pedobacter cryophilus]TKB98693.1 RagB/SusD family nutrient uptake outer membrane protein [Pedobacter cryophilus]
MKKQVIILSIILSFGLTGCEKFLTELPQDTVAPETFFKTKEQLTAALMPVYSPLGSADESTYSRFLSLEANSATDEYSARSAGTAINAGLYNASASYANFTNCWNNLYLGIERANFLLEQLETSPAPAADVKQVKGEALFLRAYYHFILVSYWGDIPLKLTSTKKASDVSRARTPVKEVYDQIIKDMTEAEGLVKTSTEWGVNITGRVSKTAVEGILSRVCLHAAGRLNDESYLPVAVSWGKKVVASNEHRLNPDYKQVFINHSQDVNDNKENLWEVEFMRDATGVYGEFERFGSTIGVQNNDVPTGFAQAGYFATGTLYDSYADGDLRRDWTIANYAFVGTDASRGKTYLNTTATASTRWRRPLAKWRREFQKADVIGIKNFGPTNYPLLRYSDVLLTLAEADNAINGPTTENIDYVNQVRRRAYGVDLVGRNVIKLTITNGGAGTSSPYTLASVVTISGGGAAKDAKAVITAVSSGRITGIALIDGGAGYTSNPTITIAGGGSGAVITPTVSNGTEYQLIAANYSSEDEFHKFIMKERSRELTGEGHHKLDLFRWGNFLTTMQAMIPIVTTNFSAMAVAYRNVTARDLTFPIPISEMELNPAMKGKQNPGWE